MPFIIIVYYTGISIIHGLYEHDDLLGYTKLPQINLKSLYVYFVKSINKINGDDVQGDCILRKLLYYDANYVHKISAGFI